MATYTIIGNDNKECGPASADDIHKWLAEGRINVRTRARVEGSNEWKTISEFSEFNAVPGHTSPPPLPAIAKVKTSRLAITSLVLGISGIFTCGITALVGLILGIMAIIKIRNSEGKLKGFGLALVGTIVSGVFLLLIPIAMLLPALAAAKQKAQEINCINNEKQLALAVRIYAGDHNDQFPHAATWCDDIKTITGSDKVFQCPADADANSRCGYAFNAKLDGLDQNKINPQTVMIFESDGGWNASGGDELMISKARHAWIFTVALADGSVQVVRESQLGSLRWNP